MDAKPKRRWGRYSLRTLMVIVTIACVGFGWLGVKVRAKQRQRETVKAIHDFGAAITYDYEYGIDDPTPPGPIWLRKLFGDDMFADVVGVGFGPQTTDEDLQLLEGLHQLKWLDLNRTLVTDAGMARLRAFTQLEWLDLDANQVGDAGLSQIQKLTRLKELYLLGTQATDEGVAELQKALPNLTVHYRSRVAR